MRVLIVSPHYDDAPLSLGQSMLSGTLAGHDLTVGVVFGRTNWARWFHPTRRRAPVVTAIRRAEEAVHARRFGYRVRHGDREEVILRLGTTDTDVYLDPDFDAETCDEIEPVGRLLWSWAAEADLVLAPLGIGGHVDHLICCAAAAALPPELGPVGFYEERPYASWLSLEEVADLARARFPDARPVPMSGPIGPVKNQRLKYPSQFDRAFLDALEIDRREGRQERVWWSGPGDFPLAGGA